MSGQVKYGAQDAFGCWPWEGKLGNDGYPVVWRGRRPSAAHRVVYELELGPVPEGKVLDHVCRNRVCVAPHHLEPVTPSENERRKNPRYRSRITTCKAGHDLRTNQVMTEHGGRVCRTCNQEAKRGE